MKLLFAGFILCSVPFCQAQPLLQKTVVKVAPLDAVRAKVGATVKVTISVQVDSGFHVNSNKPADPYLIPLRLTWNPGVLESAAVTFPKPNLENYGFSAKPVSVFTGNFDLVTRFKTVAGATPGPGVIAGKLHYQACNETMCLPPKTIEVTLPVEIVK